ncbi:rhamnogalacturonan lyase family protein [Carboxylicivirga linearis]|uniref:T9SS type A sorting domain-containing protein n=1 Tax=Carboxylicivirga linearis TaxID=1628157 RepID=A0ABS5JT83_9BACT|nr:autotransporter-associated beta strand repeat-containing protein [Carboxylicivirga linearis]MBS2098083.1 T9SS type A sorting domain-containing protein [Carboxylicivirga linearis]
MKVNFTIILTGLLLILFPVFSSAQRQIEDLDRGVVAVRTSTSEVFVSWRWLGTEDDDVSFNLYRDDTKINAEPISESTNYIDNSSADAQYFVAAIVNGVEQAKSAAAPIWGNQYLEVNLNRPTGGTTPDGVSYSYSPNDCSVGDLNGDGQYEIIVKWDPSNAKDNSQSGYTGNVYLDAYTLDGTQLWRIDLGINIRAGAHYTQFLVYDFDGDGIAELACKTAPGTKDNSGNYLSTGPAATTNHLADYRNSGGYILSGPEYLTVFSGETGIELATVNYEPPRGSVSSWGDSYGNRVDRFLACVAYLDGEKPSIVMTRGYYTRSVLAAWDWNGTQLSQRWIFDSNNPGNGAYYGQGNHNLSVADVDGDGKDEIIYGSCTIDNDGTGLYSTGLGHGDALHVSDMDPDRPGLEVFMPHEDGGNGMTYRDAATGEVLWQIRAPGEDVGRGVAADISPDHRGYERWSSTGAGTYNVDGEVIGGKTAMNFLAWWDGDLTRELLDGITISKYNVGNLLTAYGCESNNSTKATPNLSADILGDWREEVIFRTSDNTKLRIYTTTHETSHRFRTLMHDPQYRLAIAWQNVGYNQPPHPGFFLGTGMDTPPLAPISQAKLKWDGASGFNWDINNSANWNLKDGTTSVFSNGDDVLFSISGNNTSDILINQTIEPSKVSIISPNDYTFSGTGSLSGDMQLIKSGSGSLTIKTTNNYTGKTLVSEGILIVSGNIETSVATIESRGAISGSGVLGDVSLLQKATLWAGKYTEAATTTINGNLLAEDNANFNFDLSDDPTGSIKTNDQVVVNGDLTIGNNITITVNKPDGTLSGGTYTLFSFTGTFSGAIENIEIIGLRELITSIEVVDQTIVLHTEVPREPASIIWSGSDNNTWNLLQNTNWINNGVIDFFAFGDNVLFDETGNHEVVVGDEVSIGSMEVNSTSAYTFSGKGSISGSGGLIKSGSGNLTLNENNTFTGNVELTSGFTFVTHLDNIGNPSCFGYGSTDPGSITLSGAGIYFSGTSSSTNRGITIGENNGQINVSTGKTLTLDGVITGNGNFNKRGSGLLNLSSANTLAGTFTISEGNVNLLTEAANSDGFGTNSVVIKDATLSMLNNLGTYSSINWNIEVPYGYIASINLDSRCDMYGTLVGEGTLNLNSPANRAHLQGNWSGFTGQINVTTTNNGWFICGNDQGYPQASISLGDNVFGVWQHGRDATIEIGELSGASTSELGSGERGATTITWKVGNLGTNATFDGRITNTAYKNAGAQTAIVKTGTGRWTLTNSNTYTQGTIIEEGSLIVSNTTGSGTGTGSVSVESAGSLAGDGSISGAVTVSNGGNLRPGLLTQIGSLTINNSVTMQSGSNFFIKCLASSGSCDKLVVNGSLIANGTLNINNLRGSFTNGQSYQVIDANIISGSFEAISPETPGDGLYWDTSDLYTNGIIKVTDVPTAISSVKNNANISVYPNPVEDLLHIDINSAFNSAIIQTRDMSGRLINHQIIESSISEIDFSSLSNGVYFITITVNNESYITKIVKE